MKITRRQLRRLINEELDKESSNSINKWTDIYPLLVKKGSIKDGDNVIIIDGPRQRLYIVNNSENNVAFSTKVSTGKKGFGNTDNSGKTSTGLMYVSNIVGIGGPKNAVYIGKSLTKPVITIDTNKPSPIPGHAAEVLTRILVLKGHERKNKNVHGRSIYIHGTNLEYTLGSARSGGCVRVSNNGIIKLADSIVSAGDNVYVYPGGSSDSMFDSPSWTDEIGRLGEIPKQKAKELYRAIPKQKAKELYHRAIDESDNNEDLDSDEDIGTVDGVPSTPSEIEDVLVNYPIEKNA